MGWGVINYLGYCVFILSVIIFLLGRLYPEAQPETNFLSLPAPWPTRLSRLFLMCRCLLHGGMEGRRLFTASEPDFTLFSGGKK